MIQIWVNKKGKLLFTYTNGFHYSLLMRDAGYNKATIIKCSWDNIINDVNVEKIANKKMFFKWLGNQKVDNLFKRMLKWRR